MKQVILADIQDITRAGLLYFIQQITGKVHFKEAFSKKELMAELASAPEALIIIDYTLFDLTGPENLLNLSARFKQAHFLLFSDELSEEFLRLVVPGSENISILFKDATQDEIQTALNLTINKERYLSTRATNLLLGKRNILTPKTSLLTTTEQDILKLLALGKTTKEIAQERFSSVHTITTHRKNIFRKLEVNTVYEATKYALRAGVVDSAEYYI
ncbi:MAG TPA: response regulator transcription factor [Bacteroidales bacterium]|nr:response regulator transcription factor [Bacteroidales bacterium]